MNNENFWMDWYYWDYIGKWVHDDDFDFQWMIDIDPKDLSEDYKDNFTHAENKNRLLEIAWSVIKSLSVREEERGKQDWELLGFMIDSHDADKIVAVFYESNFDIYREHNLVFRKVDEDYKYINLYYEYI